FVTKVQNKDAVAEGTNGQTAIQLDALAAGKDYYWHVRATSGNTTGVFGAAFKFTIGPVITVNVPVPLTPLSGATTNVRTAFIITNAVRTASAGAITYKYEIADN